MQRKLMAWHEIKRYPIIALAVGLLGAFFWSSVASQSLPLGFGLPADAVLIFVAEQCPECEKLALDQYPGAVFVGRTQASPYTPYLWDEHDLLARTFKVESAPTILILSSGQVAARLAGYLPAADLDEVAASLQQANIPELEDSLVGRELSGIPSDFNGLVVFWREDCPWCSLNEADINRICDRQPVFVVSAQGPWPTQCLGTENTTPFLELDIPGTPTYLYVQSGTVVWAETGFRADIDLIAAALLQKWSDEL